MAVRPIHNLSGPDRDGGKKSRSGAVRATGRRVIHQIKTSPSIARSQRSEFIQFALNLFPRPMQWFDPDVVRADQFFIGHEEGAVVTQRESAIGANLARVDCLL